MRVDASRGGWQEGGGMDEDRAAWEAAAAWAATHRHHGGDRDLAAFVAGWRAAREALGPREVPREAGDEDRR